MEHFRYGTENLYTKLYFLFVTEVSLQYAIKYIEFLSWKAVHRTAEAQ